MKSLHLLAKTLLFSGVVIFGADLPGTTRYLEFPNALPGMVVKVHKDLDSQTGKINEVSDVPQIVPTSQLQVLKAEEERLLRERHGALDPSIVEKVEGMLPDQVMPVAIRIQTQSHTPLDKTRHSEAELIANSHAMLLLAPVASPTEIFARHGITGVEMRGENIAVATLGKAKLMVLKEDQDVAAIWESTDPDLSLAPVTGLAHSGYNPAYVPGTAGGGVRAATFEFGLTSTFLSCIGVTPSSYDTFGYTGNENEKRHSQVTFRTLYAAAPSATLFHRNSRTYNTTNDINYIVNNSIQTLSMSVTRGNTTPYRATYSEFLSMDNMAYNHPYPVFVQGTANAGYEYESNWQCYNCISVGNVRHTNDSTFEMANCTQTKNPPPRYGSCISGTGVDCAGDRELPLVVAPGIAPTGTTFSTSCLEGTGEVVCGTSLSAPVVNGLAADVLAADSSRMKNWPEKVRAVMVLTAQNVDGGYWSVSTDERDGSGVVSGSEAVSFAQNHTSVLANNTAVENGMTGNSFYAAYFGSNVRFNYLVPNPKPSGKHLRVVLTWSSNPNVNNGTNALSDLDLTVQKNGGTQSSSSYDANVEVVDIAAADLTAGSSYYIDMVPVTSNIPSNCFIYYALAWTWVKDHAP